MKHDAPQPQGYLAIIGLIILAAAIGIGLATYSSFHTFATNYERQAQDTLHAIADLKVAELSDWRNERLAAEAEILRQNSSFAEETQRFLAAPADAAAQARVRAWLSSYRAHEEYVSVTLLATDGRALLADADPPAPPAPPVAAAIPAALATNQVTLVDIYRAAAEQPARLTVLIPVSDPATRRQPVALVALEIDPQIYLFPYLRQWPTPSQSAETLLLRQEGAEPLTLNPLRFSPDAALTLRAPVTARAAARGAVQRPDTFSGVDYRGTAVLATIHAVPDSPWQLLVKVDADEIYAPLHERMLQMLEFFAVLAAALVTGLVLLWRLRRFAAMRQQLRAAEALQASEARYRTLVDALDVALARWEPDSTLTFTNERYRTIFGIAAGDPPRRWLDLAPPYAHEQAVARHSDITTNPRVVTSECSLRAADGGLRHIQWIDTPILDSAGAVVEFQSVGIDLTQRKHAEELIAAQRDLARITTSASASADAWPHSLAIALRVSGLDCGGLYVYDQEHTALGLVAHTGLSPAFAQALTTYLHDGSHLKLVAAGAPIYMTTAETECEIDLRAEGIRCLAIIPIYALGRLMGALNLASRSLEQVPPAARYALETISAEIGNLIVALRAEAALRESERQARALVASLEAEQVRFAKVAATVPGAITTFLLRDQKLRIPYASKAFEELYGLTLADVAESIDVIISRVPPEEASRLAIAAAESARTLQPWRNEYRYRHPARGEIWIESYAMPLRDEDGGTVWHGVATDITERKRAEHARISAGAQLGAVVEIEHALAAASSQEAIHTIMAAGIQRLFPDVTALFISRYDAERELISAVVGFHDGAPVDVAALPPLPLAPEGQGTQSQVIRSRRPLIIGANLRQRLGAGGVVEVGPGTPDTQSALYVPMVAQERVLGLIQLQSRAPGRFSAEDAGSLALVANTAAVCLQNAQLYELAQREISERIQVEATLRASERRFATIFDASPLGIVITRLDDSRIEDVNAAMLELLDVSREELIGHTALELGFWDDPQDRARLMELLQRAAQVTNFETTFRSRSGERRIVLLSAELITLNSTLNMLLQVTDITARKRAEEQLRLSEVRFRALIEQAPGAITLVGADGKLSFVSASSERVMGYRADEALGLDPSSFTHPDDLPRLLALLQELIGAPGMVRTLDYRFRHHDGSWRWVESTISNLLHEPSVGAIAFNFQDITERKQAELALRASEELYRGLMQSLDSVISTVDEAGTFLYINDVAARRLGGTPQEFIGRSMQELFPAAVAAAQLANIRTAIREDAGHVNEAQSFVQGQLRWYRTTIQPIHDETGRVIYALVNSTDIHDLKTVQQELLALNQTLEERVRQRTAEVQDLYEHAPTGYHSLDAEGRLVRVNQTELDWLGYTREELVGRPFTEIITAESRAAFEAGFEAFKARGSLQGREYEIIRKDGSIFPILLSATAVYDEDGTYVMSRSTAFDITQRKAAEAALLESESQNRLLFEASPEAIALFNADGAMLRTNHAFELLAGQPGARLVGRQLAEVGLLKADGAARLAATLEQARASDAFAAAELQLNRADGVVRDVGVRVFGLQIGGAQHYLSTLRDITAEKQAAATLRQANTELARAARAKDEFLANMSHELRTPLNAILGFGESMLELIYGPLSQQQENAILHILTSGRHLLALINDILDLSKVEAGRIELRPEPLLASEICQASLLLVREQATKKGLRMMLRLADHQLELVADPMRLKQMLVNLLSNAVKFTPEHGTVALEVEADPAAQLVRFAVQDTGIGIAADDLARLFKPFSQLDSSLSRMYEGTGLGLALVGRLAELHGGSCTAESSVGVGSRFTIALPYQPAAPAARPAATAPEAHPAALVEPVPVRARLLVAEDNVDSSQVLAEYLEARGYAVLLASNGLEALARAAEAHPDLILMDIQMPGMDGLEAMRQLRARPQSAHTPIIALTALAMPGDRERCMAAGASEYLTKPVSLKELAKVIEGLLHG